MDSTEMPILLGPDEVRQLLTFQDCIPVVREAMMALSSGRTIQTLRTVIKLDEGKLFGLMSGALGQESAFGAKLVSVFTDPATGRQAHRGIVILFHGSTGQPMCIADAEQVTLIRTAAATAVATDALARPDASLLGIFGCGAQAEAHVHALLQVREIKKVLVWGRDERRAVDFADRLSRETGVNIEAMSDPSVVAAVDIICTVTSASEPVLFGRWVQPGTHVNAVGSSVPGPVEIDQELVVRSRYIADSRASVLAQGAEFLKAKTAGVIDDDHIVAEIGEILAGKKAGRRETGDITLYKSLGHVVQDLAATAFLLRKTTTKQELAN